jgi:transcriptional regulator with XRE-family HTH domain
MLQRNVGLNLAAYRHDHGLSQEAFADVLGYHRTYVGGLERGERNLSLRAVERLADSLDVDPMALLRSPKKSK